MLNSILKTRYALSVEIISSESVPNAPLLSPYWPILSTAPPIAILAHLVYSSSYRQTGPSCLQLPLYRSRVRPPDLLFTGIQQGDPLGLVLFAMAVDEVASSLSSKINIWYLDDATLGGPGESVFVDVRKCVTELKMIGLEVSPSKCEVIIMSYPFDEFTELVTTLASDLPGLKRIELTDMELLG